MSSLRLVFAGSPDAAVPSLMRLAATHHEVVAVVTRADSPQGRRRTLAATPVAVAAAHFGIPVLKANQLAGEATPAIAALAPDLGVIVAYGGLVREPLLSTPRLGWINLHFSVLPRWRGAAPVQRAIMAGDTTTGATVFQLVAELDAGDIFATITEPIGRLQTAGSLLDALAHSGAELMVEVVAAIADGTARVTAQHGEVTLAPKLTIEDGQLDWAVPAELVSNRIRGVTPEPGAFTMIDGGRLKILDASIARDAAPLPPGQFGIVERSVMVGTATAPIELLRVHPAGRTSMDAASWWRGRQGSSS